MLKVSLYNQEGKVIGEQDLNPAIWDVKAKPGLVQEALRVQMANARQVLASVKTRGEVRGGGKKPWKQKGTGRARVGSIRSPIWRGGGIIFGPSKERNFTLKMNQKAHRQAILMCLSDKIVSQNLQIVDNLNMSVAKTKSLVGVLKNLGFQQKKLLVALAKNEKEVSKLGKNLPRLQTISSSSLNVKDLLAYPSLLVTQAGVKEIEAVYGKK